MPDEVYTHPKSEKTMVVLRGWLLGAMKAAEPQSAPPQSGAGRNGWNDALFFAKNLHGTRVRAKV